MQDGEEFDSDFVFHPGRGKFVRVVHSPSRGSENRHLPNKPTGDKIVKNTTDDETSEDEDCALKPPQGYYFVWKRDKHGEKYFLKRKLQPSSADLASAYVLDEVSGRYYKREVSSVGRKRGSTVHESSSTSSSYRDHRQASASPVPVVRRGIRTPTTADRLPYGARDCTD